MSIVMNCLDKEQTVAVGGNHFTFAPHQMKYFSNQNVAESLAKLRRDQGFMLMPESMEHLGLLKEAQFDKIVTPEEKEQIISIRREGIENYCRRLRELIYNATVSLQRDIDRAGLKYDARVEMTNTDIERLRELNKYQKAKQDHTQKKLDEIKELEKSLAISKG